MQEAPLLPVATSPLKIYEVQLSARQPKVTVEDLANMLEIELLIMPNGRAAFRRRLQRALDDAYRQGYTETY